MEQDLTLEQLKEQEAAMKRDLRNAKNRIKAGKSSKFDVFNHKDPVEAKKEYEAEIKKYEADIKRQNAELLAIKLSKAKKEVIDTKQGCAIVSEVFSKLKSILYAATNNLPAQIEGKDHAEITQIMFKFVDDALQRFQGEFQRKLDSVQIDEDDIEEEEEEN